VDGQVASQALLDLLGLVAQHVAVVAGPVQVRVGGDEFVVVVPVSVNEGRDSRDFGQQVHRVFVGVLPVLRFF
jgi:hypothetical protein